MLLQPLRFRDSSYSPLAVLNTSLFEKFLDNLSLIILGSWLIICGRWIDPQHLVTLIKSTQELEKEILKKSIHISSFKNETQMNKTTLAKYVWKQKQRHNITPTLKLYIVKSVPSYTNITRSCMLCLHEKFEILTYPNQDELWNKRSELVSKGRHINKYLLSNYKAND